MILYNWEQNLDSRELDVAFTLKSLKLNHEIRFRQINSESVVNSRGHVLQKSRRTSQEDGQ